MELGLAQISFAGFHSRIGWAGRYRWRYRTNRCLRNHCIASGNDYDVLRWRRY